jgi:hypothetical protein
MESLRLEVACPVANCEHDPTRLRLGGPHWAAEGGEGLVWASALLHMFAWEESQKQSTCGM